VRVVLDPNVLVSAAISSSGPPRKVLDAWIDERFEMIASPTLLGELRDVLHRPRFRRWISVELANEIIDGIAHDAVLVDDPPPLLGVSRDPDDDYLIALARDAAADCLVSGDRHLLELTEADPPILTPGQFLDLLQTPPPPA
jgi:putative PIN family toxin of toxin-antitoxin system